MPPLIKHRGELPSLDLEYDPKQADSQLPAFRSKLAVIHSAVKPHSGIHVSECFLLQVRQADTAASHSGPDQHGPMVLFQVLQHPIVPERQTRMKAMIMLMPSVKIDSSLHLRPPYCCVRVSFLPCTIADISPPLESILAPGPRNSCEPFGITAAPLDNLHPVLYESSIYSSVEASAVSFFQCLRWRIICVMEERST